MTEHPGIRSTTGQVYSRLRRLIVAGDLSPGTRLIELDLAQRFGVSRTPLREAMLLLQREGFVVAGNGGQQARLSVSMLTRDDARDVYQLMGEIEGLAAARAAERDDARGQGIFRP